MSSRPREAFPMWFLLIVPVMFALAQLWLAWQGRTRRAPEITATIQQHQRFRDAMSGGHVVIAPADPVDAAKRGRDTAGAR